MEFALLVVASFLVGLIGTVVGGDDLVRILALFSAYPNIVSATLVGINKVAPMSGTATAAVRHDRTVHIYWGAMAPTVVTASVFSLLGTWALTYIPTGLLYRVLPFVLAVLLVYTVTKENLDADHTPSLKD